MRETTMYVFNVEYTFRDEDGRIRDAYGLFVANSFDELVRNIRFHYKGGTVLSAGRVQKVTHIKRNRS